MATPARAFDPLFDPTYTVSGARDHYRQQTAAGGFMVEKAPEYVNMFSDLPHYPSTTFRLKNSDRVPAFVDRAFHPSMRSAADVAQNSQPTTVAGADRFKYFRKPLLTASTVHGMLLKQAIVPPVPPAPPPIPEPPSKTIGTQSDYRESEVQTLPWEPEVVLPAVPTARQQFLSKRHNCDGPELLQLKDMRFGDGLPPGMAEIQRVEKLRAKRAYEATLPPLHDTAALPLRQRMIEEWEAREWVEREGEIQGVQSERLELIHQALEAREEEIDASTAARVDARKEDMLRERAPQFGAIQSSRVKTMRQLIEARKHVETHRRQVKPTTVERYANYASTTYAPIQREGRFPELKTQIETEGFQPVTLPGLAELEDFMPKALLTVTVKDPRADGRRDYRQRQDAAVQKDLTSVNDLLETARTTKGLGRGECWPAPLADNEVALVAHSTGAAAAMAAGQGRTGKHRSRKSEVRAVERPSTPELGPPAAVQPGGEKDAAATLLQRLLRGRAAQNRMYEGKARRLQLIQELHLEGTPQASSTRPEDASAGVVQFDALLGGLVSRMVDALTSCTEPEQHEAALETVREWVRSVPDIDPAVWAATPPASSPTSRLTTPLAAAKPLTPRQADQAELLEGAASDAGGAAEAEPSQHTQDEGGQGAEDTRVLVQPEEEGTGGAGKQSEAEAAAPAAGVLPAGIVAAGAEHATAAAGQSDVTSAAAEAGASAAQPGHALEPGELPDDAPVTHPPHVAEPETALHAEGLGSSAAEPEAHGASQEAGPEEHRHGAEEGVEEEETASGQPGETGAEEPPREVQHTEHGSEPPAPPAPEQEEHGDEEGQPEQDLGDDAVGEEATEVHLAPEATLGVMTGGSSAVAEDDSASQLAPEATLGAVGASPEDEEDETAGAAASDNPPDFAPHVIADQAA